MEYLGQSHGSECGAIVVDIPPGANVNTEGDGDVLKVIGRPQNGQRTVQIDPDSDLAVSQEIHVISSSRTRCYSMATIPTNWR